MALELEIKNRIHNSSDEELLEMIHKPDDYRSDVIEYAKEVMSHRGGIKGIEQRVANKTQDEKKRLIEAEQRQQSPQAQETKPSQTVVHEKRPWPWQVKAGAIGVGALLLDFIIGWCATDLFKIVGQPFLWAIMYLMYAVLGMTLATGVFKEQHTLPLVFTSLGTSIVLRCAVVAVMFPLLQTRLEEPFLSMGPALAKAFWVTLIQGVGIYLPLLAGIRFLRKTEMQFGFAEPTDVKINIDFDEGTCKTCGKRTVIAVSRSLSFLGKRDRYFSASTATTSLEEILLFPQFRASRSR